MKFLISFLLFLFFLPSEIYSQSSEDDITTFILVRHAEKMDTNPDPGLSIEGIERANSLARKLKEVKFDAVYSTPFKRTTETAQKIADQNGVEIIEYDHRSPDPLASDWISRHKGDTALIVGHSNTTPAFANALLGREHFKDKFSETDYDNILIITISAEGARKLLHLKF